MLFPEAIYSKKLLSTEEEYSKCTAAQEALSSPRSLHILNVLHSEHSEHIPPAKDALSSPISFLLQLVI